MNSIKRMVYEMPLLGSQVWQLKLRKNFPTEIALLNGKNVSTSKRHKIHAPARYIPSGFHVECVPLFVHCSEGGRISCRIGAQCAVAEHPYQRNTKPRLVHCKRLPLGVDWHQLPSIRLGLGLPRRYLRDAIECDPAGQRLVLP